jgi:hypothetical protein
MAALRAQLSRVVDDRLGRRACAVGAAALTEIPPQDPFYLGVRDT